MAGRARRVSTERTGQGRLRRKTDRQVLARIKAGRCYTHNTPLAQSPFFDGGACSLGCVHNNTISARHFEKLRKPWWASY